MRGGNLARARATGLGLGASAAIMIFGAMTPAQAACTRGGFCTDYHTFEVVYTGELWRNARGGLKQGSRYLENIDLIWEVDAEGAFGLPGGTLFAYGLFNNANELSSEVIGDAQTVSNIDAPQAFRLYEFWYDQSLFEDRLSLRFGLYDLNSEFDVLDTRDLFINSSHGIGPDFSQTGENGPSIFPVTSLAFRARWQISERWSVQAVVLDGVPGDPDRPSKTVIDLGNGDGVLTTVELDYEAPSGLVLKGGYWRYTAKFDDLLATNSSGLPLRRSGNDGFYLEGEYPLYREAGRPDQGLSVFVRYGRAEDEINPFQSFLGFGGVYTGLLPGRPEDRFGFAVAIATNGDPYRTAQSLAGLATERREIDLEWTYHFQVTPWLAFQPDIQYVINPGTDPLLKNALVFGLRFEINYGLL